MTQTRENRSGYSGTPLAKKLGIKPGHRIKPKGAPLDYERLVAPLPADAKVSARFRDHVDIWHLFTKSGVELRRELVRAIEEIRPNRAIWVSWPKKASGVATDLTEDTIRKAALPLGLVDVKVCAVDGTWSGLKLVIRRRLRSH